MPKKETILYQRDRDGLEVVRRAEQGGVERANRTLQDRMVKLMRLDGVNNMEEGNTWLPGFMAGHNAHFATAPADPRDAHRRRRTTRGCRCSSSVRSMSAHCPGT